MIPVNKGRMLGAHLAKKSKVTDLHEGIGDGI